jgi:hypothetical protein
MSVFAPAGEISAARTKHSALPPSNNASTMIQKRFGMKEWLEDARIK